MGVFSRIREGLSRTKQQIVERFEEIVRRADASERPSRAVDVETIDALEELLISADVGVAATARIIAVRERGMSRRIALAESKRRSMCSLSLKTRPL